MEDPCGTLWGLWVPDITSTTLLPQLQTLISTQHPQNFPVSGVEDFSHYGWVASCAPHPEKANKCVNRR